MPDLFVTPATVRLPLQSAPAHWIEVKSELTYFEEKQLQGGSLRQTGLDADGVPQFRVDLAAYSVQQLGTWLVAWSFTRPNAAGKPEAVALTPDALRALTPAIGAEIEELLAEHIQALNAKNAPPATTPTMTPAA